MDQHSHLSILSPSVHYSCIFYSSLNRADRFWHLSPVLNLNSERLCSYLAMMNESCWTNFSSSFEAEQKNRALQVFPGCLWALKMDLERESNIWAWVIAMMFWSLSGYLKFEFEAPQIQGSSSRSFELYLTIEASERYWLNIISLWYEKLQVFVGLWISFFV